MCLICISFACFLKITTLMFIFIVFFQLYNKKLTESQIEILTEYYVRSCNMWEVWGDVYEAIERHRNEKKYLIFRALCRHKRIILYHKNNKFICEMDTKKKLYVIQ